MGHPARPRAADRAARHRHAAHQPGREQKSFTVSGGFLQVVDDTVTVLSESATAA
jgi:F0F1-type ATP synthase epsilon subunit